MHGCTEAVVGDLVLAEGSAAEDIDAAEVPDEPVAASGHSLDSNLDEGESEDEISLVVAIDIVGFYQTSLRRVRPS